jgi:tetratricopeptide (TPR) repeat protein
VTCARCGLESARADVFRSQRRSFSSKSDLLCVPCLDSKDQRTNFFLFWCFAAFAIPGAVLCVLLPQTTLGSLFLNIACLQLFTFICTVLHELGHVIAARLVAFDVLAIELGHGQVSSEFVSAGFRWRFRLVPVGGIAFAIPMDAKWYRTRDSVFTLGGPMVNAMLMLIGFLFLSFDAQVAETDFPFSPMKMLVFANAALLVYSLVPHEYQTERGKIPSDLLRLWQTWRQPAPDDRSVRYSFYLFKGQEMCRRRDWGEAEELLQKGLKEFPEDGTLRTLLAHVFLGLKRFEEARKIYINLVNSNQGNPSALALLSNNVAYANLLLADPALLQEADVLSCSAHEAEPTSPYYQGTRGCVLIELGRIDEGVALLTSSFERHTEPVEKAEIACYLGIAASKQNNVPESRRWFGVARKLDDQCTLLDRECELRSIAA